MIIGIICTGIVCVLTGVLVGIVVDTFIGKKCEEANVEVIKKQKELIDAQRVYINALEKNREAQAEKINWQEKLISALEGQAAEMEDDYK